MVSNNTLIINLSGEKKGIFQFSVLKKILKGGEKLCF